MITTQSGLNGRRVRALAFGMSATVMAVGILGTCDDQLVALTQYVDPCATVLGNCPPGSFQTNNADVNDWCIDPACTVPGACNDDQPLGTIRNICP